MPCADHLAHKTRWRELLVLSRGSPRGWYENVQQQEHGHATHVAKWDERAAPKAGANEDGLTCCSRRNKAFRVCTSASLGQSAELVKPKSVYRHTNVTGDCCQKATKHHGKVLKGTLDLSQ
jgi:hypothetical protein